MTEINLTGLSNRARKIQKAANAICCISQVFEENQNALDRGESCHNGYVIGGLCNALYLVAEIISEIGVDLEAEAEGAHQ